MQFFKQVQLGNSKFTIQTEEFAELVGISRMIYEMNRMCGGEGYFRQRLAEKKKGKKVTQVQYQEMVKTVKKLPFDNTESKVTHIKMRISPQTEPDFENWPYFIFRTQKWNWHNHDTQEDYFLDDDGKWYKGSYDADTAVWKRTEES